MSSVHDNGRVGDRGHLYAHVSDISEVGTIDVELNVEVVTVRIGRSLYFSLPVEAALELATAIEVAARATSPD